MKKLFITCWYLIPLICFGQQINLKQTGWKYSSTTKHDIILDVNKENPATVDRFIAKNMTGESFLRNNLFFDPIDSGAIQLTADIDFHRVDDTAEVRFFFKRHKSIRWILRID